MVISFEGDFLLPEILRDFKKHASKVIRKAIEDNPRESRKEWLLKEFTKSYGFSFWRGDNKPIELWSNHVIDQNINYVHMNPVEEGFVFRPEEYIYSRAIDYVGEKEMLNVEVVS